MLVVGCASHAASSPAATHDEPPPVHVDGKIDPATTKTDDAATVDGAATADGVAKPGATASTPAKRGEIRIVARVLETGPIGDGRCIQRSYRIEVVEATSGEAPTSPSWVHFEHCGPTTPPVDASGLDVGTVYRLGLVAGASPNFGAAPMIVFVEPAA